MKKNIFILAVVLSSFLHGSVSHESIKRLSPIGQLRLLNQQGKKHSWLSQKELELHAAAKGMPVEEAICVAGFSPEEFLALNSDQKAHVEKVLDNYGVSISESKLDRMRCAIFDDVVTGYVPTAHIIALPLSIVYPKSLLPPHLQRSYVRNDLQAFSILTELCMFDNTVKSPVAKKELEATRTDIIASFKMNCPTCIRNVSEYFRNMNQNEVLTSRGHMIHDRRKVEMLIRDLPLQEAQCKSCKIDVTDDEFWVALT